MSTQSARLSLVFSCIGHAYMHLFAAFYFVIVLQIERDWGLPYHEVIEYWTLGALLIGLCALPAGWLGDRWSAPGMMVVMFIGMGLAAVFCGLATTPAALITGLAGIGVFAAIYHPVGIAWVVRNATARGKALGINGIFGSVGVAGAGIVAGGLISLSGWRAAFIVPGVVAVLTGLVLWYCLATRRIVDSAVDQKAEPPASRGDRLRAFVILVVTMLCMGLIFQTMQAALPKVFDLRLSLGGGALGVGALVALVYAVAGLMQVVGGHLADRYPLKLIYVGGLLLQIPVLVLVAQVAGLPLVVAATLAVFLNAGILPAENMLIARYTPAHRRSLAYGIKYVLAFTTAPLAVLLVATIHEATGEFVWLYLCAAALAALALLVAAALPASPPRPVETTETFAAPAALMQK